MVYRAERTPFRIDDLKPDQLRPVILFGGQWLELRGQNRYVRAYELPGRLANFHPCKLRDNAVTLKIAMDTLPDGTSHPSTVVLGMPKRNIEVRITKSNYQKLAQ